MKNNEAKKRIEEKKTPTKKQLEQMSDEETENLTATKESEECKIRTALLKLKKIGVSRKVIARLCGVTEKTIDNWTTKTRVPTLAKEKIFSLYQVFS